MAILKKRVPEIVMVTTIYEGGERIKEQAVIVSPPKPRLYWWWPILTATLAFMMLGRM